MVGEVVKTHLPNLKTCFIATDYTCSPSVKDSSLDRYFIPASSLSGDFLGGGVTSERLRACGIPVRQMFRSSVRKEDAKRAFGIPADHKHLVMMCGSMGCGPIMSIARRIGHDLPDDQDLTIVCGTNKQLYRRLQRRFYDAKNVHVRSYVKDMALLMDSADLYLTKPGGISVTEAASMRLPMALYRRGRGRAEEVQQRTFFPCARAGAVDRADAQGDRAHEPAPAQRQGRA